MCIIEVDINDRIVRVITGDRPDWLASAKHVKESADPDQAARKHNCAKSELQICHVVAWTVLAKYVRRKFKGRTLEEAHAWLSEPENWPDGEVNPRLMQKTPGRAVNLGLLNKPSKELVEELLGAYVSQLNSWAQNLWLGPKNKNEAKGRLLKNCMNIVKRATLKTPLIYMGKSGEITCFSGDNVVEMTYQRWKFNQEDIVPLDVDPVVIAKKIIVGELTSTHVEGGDIVGIVIKASLKRQKLDIKGALSYANDRASGVLLFNNWCYYKVSQEFDITSWLNMRKGLAVVNDEFLSPGTPIRISDFGKLEEFLVFASIDHQHEGEVLEGRLLSIFEESYGSYLRRVKFNQNG